MPNLLLGLLAVASFAATVYLLRRTTGLSEPSSTEEGQRRWGTAWQFIFAKKRYIATGALLTLLVTPLLYYGYYGLVRKEHFFRGRPTSYWYQRIQQDNADVRAGHRVGKLSWTERLFLRTQLYVEGGFLWDVLGSDPAAVPVLLDLIWADDKDVRWAAILALANHTHGDDVHLYAGEARQERDENGLNRLVLILHGWDKEPGYPGCEYVALMDMEGRFLDSLGVSFPTSPPWPKRLDIGWSEPGWGGVVIGYIGDGLPENLGHTIVLHDGRRYAFSWNQSDSRNIRAEQWRENGLCRMAIRDGKLEVLFPPLRDGVEGAADSK